MSISCENEANTVVTKVLAATGIDYGEKRDAIAELFDTVLYQGIWEGSTDFDDPKFRDLLLIQEDEYDQHRGGHMPEWKDQICLASGHYIFFA